MPTQLEKGKQDAKARAKEDIEDNVGIALNGDTHSEIVPKEKERHRGLGKEEQGRAVQAEDKGKGKERVKEDSEDNVGHVCSGAILRETVPRTRAQMR